MDYAKCTIMTTDSIVVVRENRSTFELKNDRRISINKVKVDGCLIDMNSEKCDWIISISSLNTALFIELKGCDIDKGISQLKSTLQLTNQKFRNYQRKCYVVTTRIPKHGPTIRRKSLAFHKQTKATLSVKNIRATECC